MSRTKFGHEDARLTQWLPAGQIDVDPSIQRPLNVTWAEQIGRDLDPDLIGVIHVSQRANGRYVVLDGQHRLHGVKNVFGNNGTLVECKVYSGLAKSDEAAIFVGLNNFRRPTRVDVFLRNVTAKEEHAVAISAIVHELGFRVDRAKAANSITAVGAIEDVYFGFSTTRDATSANPKLLKSALSVIREAWGGTADSVNGHIVAGIGRLLAARQRAMEVGDLVHRLSGYPGGPTALVGTATGRRALTGGSTSHALVEVCCDLYNKNRRVGKIETLR